MRLQPRQEVVDDGVAGELVQHLVPETLIGPECLVGASDAGEDLLRQPVIGNVTCRITRRRSSM